jgi:Ala-tRNA(Pro) deacylase
MARDLQGSERERVARGPSLAIGEELIMNIQELLGRNNIPFDVLPHRETYSAQRMAQAVHVSGHQVAKTVLLRVGELPEYVVAVLPASHNIDFERARNALRTSRVELATECEMAQQCPDCDMGALPPFGSHYGMRTVVDEPLTADEVIVFEGRVHSEAIRMKYVDFARVENPQVVSLSS